MHTERPAPPPPAGALRSDRSHRETGLCPRDQICAFSAHSGHVPHPAESPGPSDRISRRNPADTRGLRRRNY
uniref:Uncharacterized protein n=1 Tax=Steinernema glaseri TaxID=37863 RepID=A0A1I7ZNI9_9BILA